MSAFDFGMIHDRTEVFDPLIDTGDVAAPIGGSGTPFVEVEVTGERRKPLEHATNLGSLPGDFDVLCSWWNRNDGCWPIAKDLVGDARPASRSKVDWRDGLCGGHDAFKGMSAGSYDPVACDATNSLPGVRHRL